MGQKGENGFVLRVTQLSRFLSRDEPCKRRLWFEARSRPPSANVPWLVILRHSERVRALVASLENANAQMEVQFRTVDPVVSGRADLVEERSEETIIHEVKTGREYPSHRYQVALYLWLARVTGAVQTSRIRGLIHYAQAVVEVSEADVTAVREQLRPVFFWIRQPRPPAALAGPSCASCIARACEFNPAKMPIAEVSAVA